MKVYLFLPRFLPIIIRYTPPGGDSRMLARSYSHHFPVPHGASTPPLLPFSHPWEGGRNSNFNPGEFMPFAPKRSQRCASDTSALSFSPSAKQFQAAFCMEMPGGKKVLDIPSAAKVEFSHCSVSLYPCVALQCTALHKLLRNKRKESSLKKILPRNCAFLFPAL